MGKVTGQNRQREISSAKVCTGIIESCIANLLPANSQRQSLLVEDEKILAFNLKVMKSVTSRDKAYSRLQNHIAHHAASETIHKARTTWEKAENTLQRTLEAGAELRDMGTGRHELLIF
jgi:hypothetical protein